MSTSIVKVSFNSYLPFTIIYSDIVGSLKRAHKREDAQAYYLTVR